MGVDAPDQLRRQSAGLGEAVVGEHLDVAMRDVGQRLGGGARAGGRHVGHGIVAHALLNEHRVVVGGRAREVSAQSPWSMTMFTSTLPGRMRHQLIGNRGEQSDPLFLFLTYLGMAIFIELLVVL